MSNALKDAQQLDIFVKNVVPLMKAARLPQEVRLPVIVRVTATTNMSKKTASNNKENYEYEKIFAFTTGYDLFMCAYEELKKSVEEDKLTLQSAINYCKFICKKKDYFKLSDLVSAKNLLTIAKGGRNVPPDVQIAGKGDVCLNIYSRGKSFVTAMNTSLTFASAMGLHDEMALARSSIHREKDRGSASLSASSASLAMSSDNKDSVFQLSNIDFSSEASSLLLNGIMQKNQQTKIPVQISTLTDIRNSVRTAISGVNVCDKDLANVMAIGPNAADINNPSDDCTLKYLNKMIAKNELESSSTAACFQNDSSNFGVGGMVNIDQNINLCNVNVPNNNSIAASSAPSASVTKDMLASASTLTDEQYKKEGEQNLLNINAAAMNDYSSSSYIINGMLNQNFNIETIMSPVKIDVTLGNEKDTEQVSGTKMIPGSTILSGNMDLASQSVTNNNDINADCCTNAVAGAIAAKIAKKMAVKESIEQKTNNEVVLPTNICPLPSAQQIEIKNINDNTSNPTTDSLALMNESSINGKMHFVNDGAIHYYRSDVPGSIRVNEDKNNSKSFLCPATDSASVLSPLMQQQDGYITQRTDKIFYENVAAPLSNNHYTMIDAKSPGFIYGVRVGSLENIKSNYNSNNSNNKNCNNNIYNNAEGYVGDNYPCSGGIPMINNNTNIVNSIANLVTNGSNNIGSKSTQANISPFYANDNNNTLIYGIRQPITATIKRQQNNYGPIYCESNTPTNLSARYYGEPNLGENPNAFIVNSQYSSSQLNGSQQIPAVAIENQGFPQKNISISNLNTQMGGDVANSNSVSSPCYSNQQASYAVSMNEDPILKQNNNSSNNYPQQNENNGTQAKQLQTISVSSNMMSLPNISTNTDHRAQPKESNVLVKKKAPADNPLDQRQITIPVGKFSVVKSKQI